MDRKHNPVLTPNAIELRKNMTPQERHLWHDFLKNYPVRFLRQKVIASYIADFYCAKAKLVIELDGSQHYTDDGIEYDDIRSKTLEQFDLQVIRYSNTDINNNFYGVCEDIDRIVKLKLTDPTVVENPPPAEAGFPL